MRIKLSTLIISILSFIVIGCFGLEKSEPQKRRQINLLVESIKRKNSEKMLTFPPPQPTEKKEQYPWQHKYIGSLARITKEYFRCKGDPLNLPVRVEEEGKPATYQMDCGRLGRHSLPLRDGKEFIYPILIQLLNTLQEELGKQVIITSGHRCPTHNQYVDPSKKNRVSKHLIGAEADFYVEGLEYDTHKVLATLQDFYARDPQFAVLKETNNQWINKEVSIQLHPSKNARNRDNQHPYPYFTIEVLYDREKQKPVRFSWSQGYSGFHHHD